MKGPSVSVSTTAVCVFSIQAVAETRRETDV